MVKLIHDGTQDKHLNKSLAIKTVLNHRDCSLGKRKKWHSFQRKMLGYEYICIIIKMLVYPLLIPHNPFSHTKYKYKNYEK